MPFRGRMQDGKAVEGRTEGSRDGGIGKRSSKKFVKGKGKKSVESTGQRGLKRDEGPHSESQNTAATPMAKIKGLRRLQRKVKDGISKQNGGSNAKSSSSKNRVRSSLRRTIGSLHTRKAFASFVRG